MFNVAAKKAEPRYPENLLALYFNSRVTAKDVAACTQVSIGNSITELTGVLCQHLQRRLPLGDARFRLNPHFPNEPLI